MLRSNGISDMFMPKPMKPSEPIIRNETDDVVAGIPIPKKSWWKFWKRDKLPDRVYVSVLLPFYDGSGEVKILGVYTDYVYAEARCWRELLNLGYDQPTKIVTIFLNQ